jgi:hypothetical protein
MSHIPINPATGLPMTGDGYGGVDVGGSPYGTDIYAHHNPWISTDFGWPGDGF